MRSVLIRNDQELGRVRLCRTCGEEWPLDKEFFYLDRRGKALPPCRACWAERRRAKR